MPEDNLISVLTDMIEFNIRELTAKDVALVAWALARTKIPRDAPLVRKVKNAMLFHIKQLDPENQKKSSGVPVEAADEECEKEDVD